MRTDIEDYHKIATALKLDYPKLSEFEALTLAIQIERNQLLENGLVISRNDSNPTALEAISIALGYTDKVASATITDVLTELVNQKK
ncbi:MAG: histidine kinase [Sphingobacteriales bacterium]|nr:MAG: histidine kinase [Sphingobacteriales bacterium]